MKTYRVAVVGATGMVGRKMLQVLAERKFPVGELLPFASAKSAGKEIEWCGKKYTVIETTEENIKAAKAEIVIMSAGGAASGKFSPVFATAGGIVIDNSAFWRMDKDVPLVVPEVNPEDAFNHPKGIIANPNCSTIQAMVALKPLNDAFGIKRVIYTTFQAVSGAGVKGYDDLDNGMKAYAEGRSDYELKKFPRPIAGNCLPEIDILLDNGYYKEEQKMIDETHKILHAPDMKVTATCVRVPVFYGHSESVNIEFEKPTTPEAVREVLAKAPGIVVVDDPANHVYPTALECADKDEVFVGRIRRDFTVDSGINMWIVADNIRKGAATNAVQIAQLLIERDCAR
ncbi:MAG TPA: aspartate-semialdehyde dehydrogenase [Candidatus Protoclostridium stercorigallinarum]|uniref:Aspartate-semialdehyde dehydrogenase n=1 Tax=Candidatus Protoclostridium stercorigallinarum TaxID=2838741 RepID=A0A9D1Q0W7_9FIRM|nr:aspartate-semialdehyde dehydrogenase [Candidatus Protoclostridium stercorigallinarum]